MAFRPPPKLPDLNRLLPVLQNSGIQDKNPPLYQVIHDLIKFVMSGLEINAAGITSISGGGSSSVTAGMVPYYIAPTETFTVPLYKQALFEMNIDNEGILVVDGFLIEVD